MVSNNEFHRLWLDVQKKLEKSLNKYIASFINKNQNLGKQIKSIMEYRKSEFADWSVQNTVNFDYLENAENQELLENKEIVSEYYNSLTKFEKEKIKEYINRGGGLYLLWHSTLSNLSTQFTNPSSDLAKKFGMANRWFLLLDSYLRDSELFFQLIIDPVWNKHNTTKGSYEVKFDWFFQENQALNEAYSDILLLKSFRHKISHQQYLLDFNNQNIVFINSDEFYEEPEIYPYDKFETIVLGLNRILLHLLTKFQDWDSFAGVDVPVAVYADIFPKFSPIVNLDRYKEATKIEISKDHQGYIQQTIGMCKFRSSGKTDLIDIFDSYYRIHYLTHYALFKDFVLLGHVKVILGKDAKWAKDGSLMSDFKDTIPQQYHFILDNFAPAIKNSIAHLNYQYNHSVPQYKEISPEELYEKSQALQSVTNLYLAKFLDIQIDPKIRSIAELVVHLNFPNVLDIPNKDYFIKATRRLQKDKDYRILAVFSVIFAALLETKTEKTKMYLQKVVKLVSSSSKLKIVILAFGYSLIYQADKFNITVVQYLKFLVLLIDSINSSQHWKMEDKYCYLIFKAKIFSQIGRIEESKLAIDEATQLLP